MAQSKTKTNKQKGVHVGKRFKTFQYPHAPPPPVS